MRKLCGTLGREEGQTMAEYGVVLTVITIAVLGSLAYLGEAVMKMITGVAQYIS
jgi:Flp pilus assembly pilin Flp